MSNNDTPTTATKMTTYLRQSVDGNCRLPNRNSLPALASTAIARARVCAIANSVDGDCPNERVVRVLVASTAFARVNALC